MLLDVSLYLLLLVPSAIPCSLSSLISRIHSCLFSDWRHTVSSKFCDTQAPSISTEEVVVLLHARCVFSRLCYNRHSLLLAPISLELAESKIFLAALADTRPRNLSSHSALSSYGLFASLALWQFSVSVRPLVHALKSCSASGASWSSTIHPFFGRGRVTTTTAKLKL